MERTHEEATEALYAGRDRKLEAARKQRQIRRQQAVISFEGHCTRSPQVAGGGGLDGVRADQRQSPPTFRMRRDSGVGFGGIDGMNSFRMRRNTGLAHPDRLN